MAYLFTSEQEARIKTLQKEALEEFFKKKGSFWWSLFLQLGMGAAAFTAIGGAWIMLRQLFKP